MFKPKKYTVMIIPDDDSKSRTFYISKNKAKLIFSFFCFSFIICLILITFSVQNISDYRNMKSKFLDFSAERLKVLELTRDLERIQQMDALIRKSLSASLKIDSIKPNFDSLQKNLNSNLEISYLENIPSFPPIEGYVSQKSGGDGFFVIKSHDGIDIVSKEGEPISAAASGVVVFSGWTYEFGNQIILYHGNDYFTHYGHNLQNLKNQREFVKRGETIALVGSTGISSGPHLHFEVWKKFDSMDPLLFFPEYSNMDLTSSDE